MHYIRLRQRIKETPEAMQTRLLESIEQNPGCKRNFDLENEENEATGSGEEEEEAEVFTIGTYMDPAAVSLSNPCC